MTVPKKKSPFGLGTISRCYFAKKGLKLRNYKLTDWETSHIAATYLGRNAIFQRQASRPVYQRFRASP